MKISSKNKSIYLDQEKSELRMYVIRKSSSLFTISAMAGCSFYHIS